jgi:FkbM family methyltransferase
VAEDLLTRCKGLAAALKQPLRLADVGARWGPSDRWRELAPPVEIVGFEADEAECRRLGAVEPSPAIRYEPVALGARSGAATLHVTHDPACSSLYPPDVAAVAAHPELEVAAPVGERTVQLQTLDGWCERAEIAFDVLTIDVQGAELDVLAGATTQLECVVALELEVELNPIYEGQPLFADVDHFLRGRGFALWRLGHLVHYGRRGADTTVALHDEQAFDSRHVSVKSQGGQLFWAHAHYVDADALEGPAGDRKLRAAIAAAAFGFPDLAALLLSYADGV